MSGIVDLDVTGFCNTVYDLQQRVDEHYAVDDVSAPDYRALAMAVRGLYAIVQAKYNAYAESKAVPASRSDADVAPLSGREDTTP